MKVSFRIKSVRMSISLFLPVFGFLFWLNGMLAEFFVMFGVVVFHELSHAAVAAGFGIKLKEIELNPMGGQAKLEGLEGYSFKPEMEAAVAMAGPMSNLVFAALGYMVSSTNGFHTPLIDFFIASNVILAGFNMLPALPLDGGRILRSLLVDRLGFTRATNVVIRASKIIGLAMIIGGAVGFAFGVINLNSCFIGLLILVSSGKTSHEDELMNSGAVEILRRRVKLDNVKVIPSATFAVGADLSLQDVIKQITGSDFAIVNVMSKDSQLMGTLTESQLLEAAAEKGLDCCVGRIVKPSYFPNHAG